jgi:hypothetical protein
LQALQVDGVAVALDGGEQLAAAVGGGRRKPICTQPPLCGNSQISWSKVMWPARAASMAWQMAKGLPNRGATSQASPWRWALVDELPTALLTSLAAVAGQHGDGHVAQQAADLLHALGGVADVLDLCRCRQIGQALTSGGGAIGELAQGEVRGELHVASRNDKGQREALRLAKMLTLSMDVVSINAYHCAMFNG